MSTYPTKSLIDENLVRWRACLEYLQEHSEPLHSGSKKTRRLWHSRMITMKKHIAFWEQELLEHAIWEQAFVELAMMNTQIQAPRRQMRRG
jgi:hypothetical protein